MKVSTNENRNSKHLEIPIPFYFKDKKGSSKTSSTTERDRQATAHEVRNDSANAESAIYKVYVPPFDRGTPEEWLKFYKTLERIIDGNGLTTGPSQYNLARALLTGDALKHFNNRAQALGAATVAHFKLSMQAVTTHVFPKHALQVQRRHLRSYSVRLIPEVTIDEFFARWQELNDYLALFPPFNGNEQKLPNDEIVELIYAKLPKRIKGDLERMNDFDLNETDITQFKEALERLELSYELEEKPEYFKDDSKKETQQSSKTTGKRRRDSDRLPPRPMKKPCMLHGTNDHTTDECRVLKVQAERMQASWKAQNPAQRAQKKRDEKNNKPYNRQELHNLVIDTVSNTFEEKFVPKVEEMFHTALENHNKRARDDYEDESIFSEEEHAIEEAETSFDADLDEAVVSQESMALSALRTRPTKRQKTNHLLPVAVGIINSRLGKVRTRKIRILFDSGSSGSIVVENVVRKLRMTRDATITWDTKGGHFRTSKKCKASFILPEFF